MKTRIYLCLSLFLCVNFVQAADDYISVYQYIDKYKDIAIAEMQRTGIPASIKMGQAILESSHGNSKLARNSNNHFGIKCKKEWTGKKYLHKDDDRDKRGRLIKSCFRVYSSVPDSYIDHSNFLLTRERYAGLFKLSETDYKGWAKELKRSGYATAKHYSDKLISIIEENQLYTLDFRNANPILAQTYQTSSEIKPAKNPRLTQSRLNLKNTPLLTNKSTLPIVNMDLYSPDFDVLERIYGKSYFPEKYNHKGIFLINGLRTVTLRDGETLESISDRFEIPVSKLLKYNDLDINTPPLRGQYIFLMPKEKEFKNYDFHKVKTGETLYIISQLYGVRLSSLESRNLITKQEKITSGVMIKLNGKKLKAAATTQHNFNVKKRK